MSFVAYLIAVVLFLIAGLAVPMEWDLGDFHAIAWGLAALSLGHLLRDDDFRGRFARRV